MIRRPSASNSSSNNNNNNNNNNIIHHQRCRTSNTNSSNTKESSIRFSLRNNTSQQQQHRRRRLLIIAVILFGLTLLALPVFYLSTITTSSNSQYYYMKFITSFLSFASLNRRSGTRSSSGGTTSLAARDMNCVTIESDGNIHSVISTTSTTPPPTTPLQKVLTTALWSYFAGDAMSAPTHWFYGGFPQIQQYYGNHGITTYTKPSMNLQGSILNKSNLNGGGRSTSSYSTKSDSTSKPTIIGDVINHGKREYWDPNKSIHYHATLQAGENTLEVSIARILMKSIIQNHGHFNINHFRQAYITFMTTPNSHNDTYASTCHRMFFLNLYHNHRDPIHCPDNDHHNVDTIDGLVLPTITALAVAGQPDGTIEQASQLAADTVTVTRNSPTLQRYAKAWGALVFQTVRASAAAAAATSTDSIVDTTDTTTTVTQSIQEMARNLQLRTPHTRNRDEITACYLDSAVPAMLDTMLKYMPTASTKESTNVISPKITVWDAIIKNANIGGENVHRGSCLGAIWGAVTGTDPTNTNAESTLPPPLINGLYHQKELHDEIQAFIKAVSATGSNTNNNNTENTTEKM